MGTAPIKMKEGWKWSYWREYPQSLVHKKRNEDELFTLQEKAEDGPFRLWIRDEGGPFSLQNRHEDGSFRVREAWSWTFECETGMRIDHSMCKRGWTLEIVREGRGWAFQIMRQRWGQTLQFASELWGWTLHTEREGWAWTPQIARKIRMDSLDREGGMWVIHPYCDWRIRMDPSKCERRMRMVFEYVRRIRKNP